MKQRPLRLARTGVLAAVAALVITPLMTSAFAGPVQAAKSDGCQGGNYRLVNNGTGAVVASGAVKASIPAANFGTTTFAVKGVYNEFDVGLADFAVLRLRLHRRTQSARHDRRRSHPDLGQQAAATTAVSC